MTPLCVVSWPFSTKAQFAGLPQHTLIVLFFPGGEQEKCTDSDLGGEGNMIGIIVIRKNSRSL